MNRFSKGVLKAVKATTEGGVKRTAYGWPPPCAGFLHQSKRPQRMKKDK
ncbi:MAG: cyclic lactone autoinducer peptide [Lachnospiraceae bacterium]